MMRRKGATLRIRAVAVRSTSRLKPTSLCEPGVSTPGGAVRVAIRSVTALRTKNADPEKSQDRRSLQSLVSLSELVVNPVGDDAVFLGSGEGEAAG